MFSRVPFVCKNMRLAQNIESCAQSKRIGARLAQPATTPIGGGVSPERPCFLVVVVGGGGGVGADKPLSPRPDFLPSHTIPWTWEGTRERRQGRVFFDEDGYQSAMTLTLV